MIRESERRALKAYFSGEPLEQVCRRFGYSRIRIKSMAEDYKSGTIDIFGPMVEIPQQSDPLRLFSS